MEEEVENIHTSNAYACIYAGTHIGMSACM